MVSLCFPIEIDDSMLIGVTLREITWKKKKRDGGQKRIIARLFHIGAPGNIVIVRADHSLDILNERDLGS